MNDELKVTVVATGLGDHISRASLQVVDSAKPAETMDDYKKLDRPTVMRNKPAPREEVRSVTG